MFRNDYAYFSSTSLSWLEHAKHYSAHIIKKLSLDESSFVIEIASNDGYLLKNFVSRSVPCLGIEPTESTAAVARDQGVPVLEEFFSSKVAEELACKGLKADLIIGNNVYAHVPDIHDFTRGLKTALKRGGSVTLEFPHLISLLKFNQFDTIYHEHYSYLSITFVSEAFRKAGLRLYDVEEIETHGGSLRVYGCHDDDAKETTNTVTKVLASEYEFGVSTLAPYRQLQTNAEKVKLQLLQFLLNCKENRKSVVAYGAAAKGNTLLNYAGVKPDLLPAVYDAAKSKQGMFMPGSHIPIRAPERINEYQPDFVIVLPWNIANEVKEALQYTLRPEVQFVAFIPEFKKV